MSFLQNELAQRLSFFLLLTVIMLLGLGAGLYFSSNPLLQVTIVSFLGLVTYLGFKLASIPTASANRVRIIVVSCVLPVVTLLLMPSNVIISVILQIARKNARTILEITGIELSEVGLDQISPTLSTQVLVVLLTAFICFVALWGLSSASPMGEPDKKIKDVLPSVTNLERLEILKRSLRDRLDRIDQATRWSAASYVPLEAEVQVLEGRASRRKVVDLMRALRSERTTRIFVVLGEPGSGKSVAMRKLARDLLDRSQQSDRIPVYLNLKEWRAERNWTLEDPPTEHDFHEFVLRSLQDDLDYNSQAFLRQRDPDSGKTIYERLFEAGYFFFILDSFDEIPAVLDHEETSWLIERLSSCVTSYVLSGRKARAVIASRLFRKPKIIHGTRSVYEIRPFSDDRIIQAIRLGADSPSLLARIILTERADLGLLARNPFLLHLIINYFNNTQKAPDTQAEIFQAYVDANLQFARDTYRFRETDNGSINMIAEDIAYAMFQETNTGLEISESELRRYISDPLLPKVLRFLTQSRLGRLGGETGTFSFAHRRFNEYFLVRRLSREQGSISLDAIQTDSRLRDALVLYAEIAPKDVAEQLVTHAWSFARNIETLSLAEDRAAFVQARNALRFQVEGFRNRREAIEHLKPDLARIIRSRLNRKSDFLETRTILEAVSLLDARTTYRVIILALRKLPPWLTETTATAARYLPSTSAKLLIAIYDNTIDRFGAMEAARQGDVFRISNATKKVATWLNLFRFDVIKATISVLLLIAISMYTLSPAVILGVSSGLLLLLTAYIFDMINFTIPLFKSSKRNKIKSLLEGSKNPAQRMATRRAILSFHTFMRAGHNVAFFLLLAQIVAMIMLAISELVINDEVANKGFSLRYDATLWSIGVIVFGLIPTSPATWHKIRHPTSKRFVKFFTGSLLLSFVGSIAIVVATGLIPEHLRKSVFTIILSLLTIPMAYVYCTSLFSALSTCYKDYVTLREAKLSFVPSRQWIAETYLSIRTNLYRAEFLDWLEQVTLNHIEKLAEPTDHWPNGRPQLPNDPNSIRLAQLDARWSSLD